MIAVERGVAVEKGMSTKGKILTALALLTLTGLGLGLVHPAWWWSLLLIGPLWAVALHDLLQRRRTLLRNYPVLGHGRYLIEDFRHHFRQYLIESDLGGAPFSHEQRALVYRRAKGVNDVLPFGTLNNVYASGHEWLNHSMQPRNAPAEETRIPVGGPDCEQVYPASHFNISALSFGSLSSHAILALNGGAARGGFYHNTGEGGICRYHREYGGDLVWEIGSGYFGCRTPDGGFDPEQFRDKARSDQVRMIEIKISQGAKPGGGGVLPASKLTPELAEARSVPLGRDVLSPASHSEFDSPVGLVRFIARLRELSGGKPVGIKLCLGRRVEFMATVKAMLAESITPDFITVDGAEGGTGAATLELSNAVGMPLRDALVYVHNSLYGAGLRDRVRIIAGGKVVSAFDIARSLALGADLCNSGRGMMFALGCIQARKCETNRCPTGVATQNPLLASGLSVPDKIERVHRYHRNTIRHLLELTAATGFERPEQLGPHLFHRRLDPRTVVSYQDLFPWLESGELLDGGSADPWYAEPWQRARAESFRAA